MSMKAWDDIAPEPLAFPIGGKTYTIPEVGYRAMLTIQRIKVGDLSGIEGMGGDETWRLVMGAAYDEMVADDVPAEALARAGLAALADAEVGRAAAENIWEHGVDPKALTEAIAQQTALQKRSSTVAASGTPSAAPSSGTSSRPASPGKKPKAKGSRSAT